MLAISIAMTLAGPGARAQPAQAQLHDMGALAAGITGFAGAPARVDPRLVVPHCPAPLFSWARADVVRAACPAPAWTLYVPVAAPMAAPQPVPRSRPSIRRGEKVMVEASGPGFAVLMAAEAERDAEADRVAVKSPAGRRFTARILEGGRLVLPQTP